MRNRVELKFSDMKVEDSSFATLDTSIIMRNGRTVMSEYQKNILMQSYECNKFPSKSEKLKLSKLSGLPFTVISNWIYNKRRKDEICEYGGSRNGRTLMTSDQRGLLENSYSHNKFPSKGEKIDLSESCSLPYMVICNWFQNRRRKDSLPN